MSRVDQGRLYGLSLATLYAEYTRRHLVRNVNLHLPYETSLSLPMRDLSFWCPNFDGEAKTSGLGCVASSAGYCSEIGPQTLGVYCVR